MADQPKLKFYEGTCLTILPTLRSEDRSPLGVEGLLRAILQNPSDQDLQGYICTGDGILHHPTKKTIKIVRNVLSFLSLNDLPRNYGALVLNERQYNSLFGDEFHLEVLEKIHRKYLTQEMAVNHLIWQSLVPDQTLLRKFVDHLFSTLGEGVRAMKVSHGFFHDNAPELRLLDVGKFSEGSCLYGHDGVELAGSRMIGRQLRHSLRDFIRDQVENSARFSRMKGTGIQRYHTRIDPDTQEVVLTFYERSAYGSIRIQEPSKYQLPDLLELEIAVQEEFEQLFCSKRSISA